MPKAPHQHAPKQGFRMERVKGIEPSYAAWEAAVLPLNYTRLGAVFTAAGRAGAIGCDVAPLLLVELKIGLLDR